MNRLLMIGCIALLLSACAPMGTRPDNGALAPPPMTEAQKIVWGCFAADTAAQFLLIAEINGDLTDAQVQAIEIAVLAYNGVCQQGELPQSLDELQQKLFEQAIASLQKIVIAYLTNMQKTDEPVCSPGVLDCGGTP